MELEFIKVSPTQNMTVLVKSPVREENRLFIGSELIKYESVYGEQAGFITDTSDGRAISRLDMMAGEFCGNATMSLASYIAFENGLKKDDEMDIPLEVSGTDDILVCHVKALGGSYRASVNMPLPLRIIQQKLIVGTEAFTVPTVEFEGIKHIIMPKILLGNDFKCILEKSIEILKEQVNYDAFGIIVYDEDNGRIDPLVIVKSANSVYWEKGCGSGTEAVGVYLAGKYKKNIFCDIEQPGGTITVEVEYDNGIKNAKIHGNVKIVAEGTAYIDDVDRP